MARSMLQTKELRNQYWADAISKILYILNRIPTPSLDGITPYEALLLKKLNVRHFKIFGYLAYVHVPKELRKKLDAKSEPCIFIDYS